MKRIEQSRRTELRYMQTGPKIAIFNMEYFELNKEDSKLMCFQLCKVSILTDEERDIILRYIDLKK